MNKFDWIPVVGGGKSDTKDGEYDCAMQGKVIQLGFANAGINVNVVITFGGFEANIPPGASFNVQLSYPYVDTTKYRYRFVNVGAGPFTPLFIISAYKAVGC